MNEKIARTLISSGRLKITEGELNPGNLWMYDYFQGTRNTLYHLTDPDSEVQIVLKHQHAKQENDRIPGIDSEIKMLRRLAGKSALPEIHLHGDEWFLTSHYGPNLTEWIENQPREARLTNSKLELMINLTEGIAQIHSEGIVHADLTPRNILIDKNKVKIIDLECAFLAGFCPYHEPETVFGTLQYLTPEQLYQSNNPQSRIGCETDIYVLGTIFYEMLCHTPLVEYRTHIQAIREITGTVEVKSRIPQGYQLPRNFKNCLLAMLEKSPKYRPTANEVVEILKKL